MRKGMRPEEGQGGNPRRPARAAAALSVVLLLSLMACGGDRPRQEPEKTVVALVNGQPIHLQTFREKLVEQMALAQGETAFGPADLKRLRAGVLNRLIDETLMLQRARDLSMRVGEEELAAQIAELKGDYDGPEFNALFGEDRISYSRWREALRQRMLLEKVIEADVNAAIAVDEEEARRYYRDHRKAYETQRRVRAAQIVIRDHDRAEEILKRLKAGEDFAKVAREVSVGPEAAQGGDLGFFEQGQMPEEIDRAVFALRVGRLSKVVQSPYGYHIFKVLARQQEGGRTFVEVRDRVMADVRRLKEGQAYERWIETLRAQAVIEIADPLPDPLSVTPRGS